MTSNHSIDTVDAAVMRKVEDHYTIGADLGQANDPTAIASIARHESFHVELDEDNEPIWQPDGKPLFRVGYLERMRLGTPYPAVVAHIKGLCRQERYCGNSDLVIDFTGVGRAVYDLFVSEGVNPIGISITGGDAVTRDGSVWRVPKSHLISRTQTLLHEGRLQIQKSLPDASALVAELQNFRAEVSDTGHWRFGAKAGKHDDLVLALAIAVWRASQQAEGIFDFYRKQAAKSDRVPNGRMPPEFLVKLKAPAGVSNIYTAPGRQANVDDEGCVEVWPNEAAALLRAGFTKMEAANG